MPSKQVTIKRTELEGNVYPDYYVADRMKAAGFPLLGLAEVTGLTHGGITQTYDLEEDAITYIWSSER